MCICTCKPQSFINNPSQAVLGFKDTRFPDSYESGFESGVTWDANWMPGGPWVYTGTKLPELREADEAKHRAWHEGFNAGLKLRLEDRRFAKWWHANRPGGTARKINGQYQRYTDPDCLDQAA